MKYLKELEDMEGKVIQRAAITERLKLVTLYFTDGTEMSFQANIDSADEPYILYGWEAE